ncbi:gamma-glutamyltranspeptidase 1-like isoform X2, partial [Leptotrombidium deliense]
YESKSKLVVYQNAAVATDAPYCAPYGREILEKNGSAIDAAISVLLCMGVVIPESMGLGGGPLITYYDAKTKTAKVIDGREVAPLRSSANMFKGNASLAGKGPLSIAVPGELKAYWTAHQMYGRLPWSTLFDGAIKMSESGFTVHEHLATVFRVRKDVLQKYDFASMIRDVFTNPQTNQFYKEGEFFKFPLLAKTLRKIANLSADYFYNGELGEQLVAELREMGK